MAGGEQVAGVRLSVVMGSVRVQESGRAGALSVGAGVVLDLGWRTGQVRQVRQVSAGQEGARSPYRVGWGGRD